MKIPVSILLKLAFWSLVSYFVVVRLLPQIHLLNLSREFAQVHIVSILPAIPLVVLHYLVVFLVWVRLLRTLDVDAPIHGLYRAYVLSLLPKYLPGAIVAPGVRVRLAQNVGVSSEAAASSVIAEMGLGVASVAVVALLGLWLGSSEELERPARLIVGVCAVGVLVTLVAASFKGLGTRWQKWVGVAVIRQRPRVAGEALALFAIGWLLSGVAHLALSRAVSPHPPPPLPMLVLALAVSWGAGFLSVLTPAGLGVREGVFFVFARTWMGAGEALVFVVLSRLVSLAGEVMLTALLWLWTVGAGGAARVRRAVAR